MAANVSITLRKTGIEGLRLLEYWLAFSLYNQEHLVKVSAWSIVLIVKTGAENSFRNT
jgi:hypothetical protein